jgi:predicted PurR-regulated permease PerM
MKIGSNRSLIIALIFSFLIGLIIIFVSSRFIKQIKKIHNEMLTYELESVQDILKIKIQFLKARRAEKNMLIFKEVNYKKEIEACLKEIDFLISKLKKIDVYGIGKEFINSIERNMIDYNRAVDKIIAYVSAHNEYSVEEIKLLNEEMREINDRFAEDINLFLNTYLTHIKANAYLLDNYLKQLKIFLLVMLPLSIVLGYITGNILFYWDVEI